MELALRVVFSLAAVLGLVWFLARVASSRMGGSHAAVLRVVGRQSLGRTSSVAVVAVGERVLVLGVTEAGVRLLTELDPDEIEDSVLAGSGTHEVEDPSHRVPTTAPGALPSGSVLSPATWRQAWHAASTRGGSPE